jgi:hypothetical protein
VAKVGAKWTFMELRPTGLLSCDKTYHMNYSSISMSLGAYQAALPDVHCTGWLLPVTTCTVDDGKIAPARVR